MCRKFAFGCFISFSQSLKELATELSEVNSTAATSLVGRIYSWSSCSACLFLLSWLSSQKFKVYNQAVLCKKNWNTGSFSANENFCFDGVRRAKRAQSVSVSSLVTGNGNEPVYFLIECPSWEPWGTFFWAYSGIGPKERDLNVISVNTHTGHPAQIARQVSVEWCMIHLLYNWKPEMFCAVQTI